MFEARLRLLLSVVGVVAFILLARLGQLQLVHADFYRQRTDRALVLRPTSLPFVRGRILDRNGEILVQDEPAWDLSIDYAALAAGVGEPPAKFDRQLKRWQRTKGWAQQAGSAESRLGAFQHDIAQMWKEIAAFGMAIQPVTAEDLKNQGQRTHKRISFIRKVVMKRRGFDAPVAEEFQTHSLLSGLNAGNQVRARETIVERYPWIHVEPSSVRRVRGQAHTVAHLMGQMGRVNAEHVKSDPNADDPFAKYRANEKLGITGVERVAEQQLRGRRGQLTTNRRGEPIQEECFDAEDGSDVVLSLNAALQRELYDQLAITVDRVPESCGGAIVVLDVATREVLALVSYPSYDPNLFNTIYATLREDTDRLPLRFRAVSNQYAPGSTVKPLACLYGLMTGKITLNTRDECTGYLFSDVRDKWRCWKVHGTSIRKAHGPIDVVEALTGSCNIFMYRLGEKIGVDGLCNAFDMVNIGRPSGTGLSEEARGINPTPSWLMSFKNIRATAGTARLFAIGQAEVSLTPIQVANLMATYASGVYRTASLFRHQEPELEHTLPMQPEHWRAIRRGIYGVVNDPDGTAHKQAYFEHERFALCGKTGSATAHRWPTAYRIPYTDDTGVNEFAIIRAGAQSEAMRKFSRRFPTAIVNPDKVEVASRWPIDPPPPNDNYSHAWFGGYLQKRNASGQPDWNTTPAVAFAALVEFGGSGGRTTGPLAKKIAQTLVDFELADGIADTITRRDLKP